MCSSDLIIERTEEELLDRIPPLRTAPKSKGGAITRAASEVGHIVEAKLLITFTQSGDSARRMSRLRSEIPMIAITPEHHVFNQLALSWGVQPMISELVSTTDEMVRQADKIVLKHNLAEKGNLVVIVAGSPPGIPGSINAMRVHKVGDAVDGVVAAYRK